MIMIAVKRVSAETAGFLKTLSAKNSFNIKLHMYYFQLMGAGAVGRPGQTVPVGVDQATRGDKG